MASLVLDDDNFKVVDAAVQQTGAIVLSCASGDGKSHVVHGFQVWWHGVGERSLVEMLPSKLNNSQNTSARIELKRDGVNVIRWAPNSPKFETCLSLPTDSLFDLGKEIPNKQGLTQLEKLKTRLAEIWLHGFVLSKIQVTGHTDRLPFAIKGKSNFDLSERRADEVRNRLDGLALSFDVLGVGPLEPKVQCPDVKNPKALEECLAPNRRVEMRISLIPVPAN